MVECYLPNQKAQNHFGDRSTHGSQYFAAEPSRKTPTTAMLEVLTKAELGGKRICFGDKKGDHVNVLSRLEE